MLKHCAGNRKRRLSALPNVGPYIYDVKISGLTRGSIYIYDISRLRVNGQVLTSVCPKLIPSFLFIFFSKRYFVVKRL
jgi:hypothetical protein